MSWTGNIKHPSQILNVGDDLEVMILDIDSAKKRISLSIKQLEPNPWDSIAEDYPVGTIIEGKIKEITEFGIFIGIAEGIDGLVHITDMTWNKPTKRPSELYTKGKEVQAVVLNIDKENERFSLGIKQLTPDPWDAVPEKYKPGALVEGTITNITDFGLFVELESGIEGLAHISELPNDKGDNPLSRFQVGDVVQTKVAGISLKDKKIRLSMQRLDESTEEDIYSYVNNHKGVTSNLGEILKEEITNQKERTLH
jgi:small subunit ribosomal protein S1